MWLLIEMQQYLGVRQGSGVRSILDERRIFLGDQLDGIAFLHLRTVGQQPVREEQPNGPVPKLRLTAVPEQEAPEECLPIPTKAAEFRKTKSGAEVPDFVSLQPLVFGGELEEPLWNALSQTPSQAAAREPLE